MESFIIDAVFYSPTGTSRKVAEAVAEGMAAAPGMGMHTDVRYQDLTRDFSSGPLHPCGTVAVVAAPVYGGRVAETAVARISRLKGEGTAAVAIVLYGNRDYEDALVELQDLLEDRGFKVVAAAAFIGEHSYSRPWMPIAEGRPDGRDMDMAKDFGAAAAGKLLAGAMPDGRLAVPGNRPYKVKGPHVPQAPLCDDSLCLGCGTCAGVCPVEAISLSSGKVVADSASCTKCCACVKNCPAGALVFDSPFAAILYRDFSERKEPATFL